MLTSTMGGTLNISRALDYISVPKYGVKGDFMTAALTISQLAREAEVNVETIRYYQRRGLLVLPEKPPIGVRRYPIETVERIRFIKRVQALGFSLEEVIELLRFTGVCVCTETRTRLADQIEQVDKKIAVLIAMRQALDLLTGPVEGIPTLESCPLIDALGKGLAATTAKSGRRG
ncbi:MerR family transcriptional regulator [Serratia sp. FS14]|nr:MerR family transcriptional regulator [Serratia sp. FS14]